MIIKKIIIFYYLIYIFIIENTVIFMSLDNKNIENPYFIIAAGPTASGKSTITQKISQYIMNNELLDINKTIFISVDDYIEKNPYFFSQVDNYFKKNFKNKKQDLYKEFINPSKKTIIFFNKIYWETRKNIDCVTGKKITKQDLSFYQIDIGNSKELDQIFQKHNITQFDDKSNQEHLHTKILY